jgi:hypothetical protein
MLNRHIWGGISLFRGFWTISWRKAQEYEFSESPYQRGFTDNGESWASRAQAWMFELFDLAWGLRNADEHGVDLETQRMIRLAKCERAIRRLYHAGESLPLHERHPFRDPGTLGQLDRRLPTCRTKAGQRTDTEESALHRRILWSA